MASSSCNCRNIVNHHHHHHNRAIAPPPIYSCTAATTDRMTSCFSTYSYSFKLDRRNSFPPKRNSWLGCPRATGPTPEPPSEKHLSPISGVTTTFTRFQDTLRIVFAVLFWMSLFFWSSIWDRGSGGSPNKRSRFKK
ncbi:hypothetical protein AAHA92_19241 [Salvia divinorum]|uniref:Transmembrane protein n=1 Tax=Salvia divinorum TaxID=28513 RepID=A0ABD1H5W9_SALDI